jgi:hypothetical protein
MISFRDSRDKGSVVVHYGYSFQPLGHPACYRRAVPTIKRYFELRWQRKPYHRRCIRTKACPPRRSIADSTDQKAATIVAIYGLEGRAYGFPSLADTSTLLDFALRVCYDNAAGIVRRPWRVTLTTYSATQRYRHAETCMIDKELQLTPLTCSKSHQLSSEISPPSHERGRRLELRHHRALSVGNL